MRPIFCGNFDYEARQSDVERLFSRYGRVERVDMKSGFAFVYMEDERDAEDAIRRLDRAEFGRRGRRLRVEWTRQQERGFKRTSGVSKRPVNTRPSKTLFVINFDPHNTRTRDIERHFEPFGRIMNVRIRKNFAFVHFETQEEADRALDATNMSKFMDRIISVEYAVRDDDERNGRSPERGGDRFLDRRNYERRRSLSPYNSRIRGSPDYGHGPSIGYYGGERGSPVYIDSGNRGSYGRDRNRRDNGDGAFYSPPRRERASPDYGGAATRGPPKRGRPSPDYDSRAATRSPYKRGRVSPDFGSGAIRSPARRRRISPDYGNSAAGSPYRRNRASPDYDSTGDRAPYGREKISPDYGGAAICSPHREEKISPEYGGAVIRTLSKQKRDSMEHVNEATHSPCKRERANHPYDDAEISSPSKRHMRSPHYDGAIYSPPRRGKHDRSTSGSPCLETENSAFYAASEHGVQRRESPDSDQGYVPNHSPHQRERSDSPYNHISPDRREEPTSYAGQRRSGSPDGSYLSHDCPYSPHETQKGISLQLAPPIGKDYSIAGDDAGAPEGDTPGHNGSSSQSPPYS